MNKFIFILFFLCCTYSSFSQDYISIENTFSKYLKKEFNLSINTSENYYFVVLRKSGCSLCNSKVAELSKTITTNKNLFLLTNQDEIAQEIKKKYLLFEDGQNMERIKYPFQGSLLIQYKSGKILKIIKINPDSFSDIEKLIISGMN
jgi:hypothetical protein